MTTFSPNYIFREAIASFRKVPPSTTTKSLIERRDTIVVASVSSIYGLGSPEDYRAMQLALSVGLPFSPATLAQELGKVQYDCRKQALKRGTYRIRGNTLDIFPADSESKALRVELADGVIRALQQIDPTTEAPLGTLDQYRVSSKTLFAPTQKSGRCRRDQNCPGHGKPCGGTERLESVDRGQSTLLACYPRS